ncbi:hypothetical protein [Halorubellus litoreus]|uniref:LexA-binding, inner membrane-associated hydrolase n=1 Tax=Halorubellus litoreus TaxID=755308 RepID=A0ABD5VPI9_9EURY
MLGDGGVAVVATVHAFFRDSIDASRYLAVAVAVGSPFGLAAVVDEPIYLLLVFGVGVGLATYYVLHYPVRYYDPLAGESVNWDAVAVAVLLFAYLLPSGADVGVAVALAVAIVGLWVAVVAGARIDVHAPPKRYHHVRRDDDPEPSPRVERAVAWLAATPPLRAMRSMRDAFLDRLRADRQLAWWVGAAASGTGFLTSAFVLDLPDAVPWALLLGLAPVVYHGTDPERPETTRHKHRGFIRQWAATTAGLVVSDDGLAVAASAAAFVLLIEGMTVAEQVRIGDGFGDTGRGGPGTEVGNEGVDDPASSSRWTDGD